MKTIHFFFAFLMPLCFAFASPAMDGPTSCPAPANVGIVSQTSSSVSFDWDDCGCAATEYRVYYIRNGQSSQEFSTSSSNMDFTGLGSGAYQFYFYTVCGSEVSSIIIEEIMMG